MRFRDPTKSELAEFCNPILLGADVTPPVLERLFRELPDVVVLTATQATSASVNRWAKVRAGPRAGQITVHTRDNKQEQLDVHLGQKLRLIRTIDFDGGLVNGVEGKLLDAAAAGLLLQLTDGEVVRVWRTAREYKSSSGRQYFRMAFEVEDAYATTVHQAEGQSLDSVCVVFEHWAPAGWAYTGLTRARSYERLRLIGRPATRHFHPRK